MKTSKKQKHYLVCQNHKAELVDNNGNAEEKVR